MWISWFKSIFIRYEDIAHHRTNWKMTNVSTNTHDITANGYMISKKQKKTPSILQSLYLLWQEKGLNSTNKKQLPLHQLPQLSQLLERKRGPRLGAGSPCALQRFGGHGRRCHRHRRRLEEGNGVRCGRCVFFFVGKPWKTNRVS